MSAQAQVPFVPGPILGAGLAKSIAGAAPLPNVHDTIRGWFKSMIIGVVTATPQESGRVSSSAREFRTAGVIMPGDGELLKMLKEGERSWKNGVLYVEPQFDVGTDTLIVIDGVNYRILKKADYGDYGYMKYSILEDFTGAGAL